MTLFGNGVLADVIKVIKVGPNPLWLVSWQVEGHLDTESVGRMPCDTDIRVLWVRAKECQGLINTEIEKRQRRFSPTEGANTSTSDF